MLEAGIEQMMAKRKEDSNDEGSKHQSWSDPMDTRHCRNQFDLGSCRLNIGDILVQNESSQIDIDGVRRSGNIYKFSRMHFQLQEIPIALVKGSEQPLLPSLPK